MKKKAIAYFALATLLFATVYAISFYAGATDPEFSNSPTADWWPMFHLDPTHTGNSKSTAPTSNQTLWKFNTGGPVDSPVVAHGVVYAGSDNHLVYAFGPSPSEQTYSVTFTHSGLRSGITWTVVLNSQYHSSYSNSITFSV